MSNEIKDEIKAIAASLAGIGNANCYRVPDNYFEALADEVMNKIQLPATSLPYTAPAATYFDGLAGAILNKIKSNGTTAADDSEATKELKELSPFLAGIKKADVYTVPAGYFDAFKVAVPGAAKRTAVKPLYRPVRWVRYAVAAAITGIIAIGGFSLLKNNGKQGGTGVIFTNDYTAGLSKVSDDAITNYLKDSPEEMDITPANFDDNNVSSGSLTEQLLKDISDADIQEYLQQNQQTGENDIKGI